LGFVPFEQSVNHFSGATINTGEVLCSAAGFELRLCSGQLARTGATGPGIEMNLKTAYQWLSIAGQGNLATTGCQLKRD
jgi:hypothetical protein